MWWIRLVNIATHIPAVSHVAKAAGMLVLKLGKGLLHSNIGLLGLDRLFSHFGF